MNHLSKIVSFPARKSISRFTPLYQISYIKLYNHEIPWHPIKSPRKQMKSPLNDHVTVPVRWWWTGQDFPQQQGWPFTPSWCIQRHPWSINWWRWDTLCLDLGMDQYLLIPFLGGWTSIYQLFWCSPGVQGFDTLPFGTLPLCGDDKGWSHSGPLQMEPSCTVQHGPCGGIFCGSCNAVLQLLGRCVWEKLISVGRPFGMIATSWLHFARKKKNEAWNLTCAHLCVYVYIYSKLHHTIPHIYIYIVLSSI